MIRVQRHLHDRVITIATRHASARTNRLIIDIARAAIHRVGTETHRPSTRFRRPAMRPRAVRWSFAVRGVRITRVINGAEHARCFPDMAVTKRPDVFGIDLHVDDSDGVAIEGDRLGFWVLRIKIDDSSWTEKVLEAVEKLEISAIPE